MVAKRMTTKRIETRGVLAKEIGPRIGCWHPARTCPRTLA